MKRLNKTIDNLQTEGYILFNEDIKSKENRNNIENVNRFDNFIKKFRSFSTEWVYLDSLKNDDDEVTFIHKQWDILLYSSTDEDFLQTSIERIVPFFHYQVLWKEPEQNPLKYYSDGLELQSNYFFEIKDGSVYLNVSVVAEKYFDSTLLTVPQAKVLIRVNNPTCINS